MTIVFYDAENGLLYLCTEFEPMKKIPVDDPNLFSFLSDDDVYYVENVHIFSREQFEDYITGNLKPEAENNSPTTESISIGRNSKYIHPTHNGSILITDISTAKFPNGIELVGKYSFLCVDDVGGFEILEESPQYRFLLAKSKIEIVDHNYVLKNQNKGKKTSQRDAALDAMIIKDDRRGSAEKVAASGGIQGPKGDIIELFINN